MKDTDNKQVDKVYNIVKDKASKFTKEELEAVIISDGYSKDIAKEVVKRIHGIKENSKDTKPEDKEKILAEISKSLKLSEKPKKKSNGIITTFKKAYFFFEDKYYSMVDGIDKVIPIGGLVDGIDKVFPSFILFILLIIGLICLFLFSGVIGFGGIKNLEVNVIDTLQNPLANATVILTIEDINTTKTTDAFGVAVFEEINYKKNKTKITIQKEAYNNKVIDLKLKKKNNSINAVMTIDTTMQLYQMEQRTRTILFKENSQLLATMPIQVTLRCANSGKTPNPSFSVVNNGQLTVDQVYGCGELKVDVASNNYNPIQNQVVPEDNVIMLSLKANNSGKLEVYVKDQNTQQVMPGVLLTIYRPDDITTPNNESNIPADSKTTDIYGRSLFDNLAPGNYTISTSGIGYISQDRFGPYSVTVNNTTVANISLIPGNMFLTVILVDSNGSTTNEVKGDISLLKKGDTNTFGVINTANDVNTAQFALQASPGARYKIAVTGTQEYGYHIPDPVDINNFDGNRTITIPLEYSSGLNTGKIGVHVERDNYSITGATVYLYREDNDDLPVSTCTTPPTTNSNGDCNITMVRADREYYAYAISGTTQGTSNTRELDANTYLQLNVSLGEQARILNLKVNGASDYNVTFFDSTGDQITNYSKVNVSGADSNKDYVFRDGSSEVYALIYANGKATYQTDIINLLPGDKVYKNITLTSTNRTPRATITSLGIYDESGTNKVTSIDLVTDRTKTFRLKFKFTTTNKDSREKAHAYVRAGTFTTLCSDYLRLQNIFAPFSEKEYGVNFSGTTPDWNYNHYSAYYNTDHTQTSCSLIPSGFKWTKIDFSDSNAEEIEFSITMRFQNGVTTSDKYKIYFKGLTEGLTENYVLSPTLNQSWRTQCNIIPNGYFYSPYDSNTIPLNNSEYGFIPEIYDYNLETNTIGTLKEKNGTKYELFVDKGYYYSQKFLYLKQNQNLTNKDINADSTGTLNNLIYKSYTFKSTNNNAGSTPVNLSNPTVNNTKYSISGRNASFGTEIDHNSVLKVNGFFTVDSNITTRILGITAYNPYNLQVLSYYPDSNVFAQILTSDITGNNNIYIGSNVLSFKVKTNTGVPISGVKISYKQGTGNEVVLGQTNNQGELLNIPLSFATTLAGSEINFIFTLPSDYGLPNNEKVINKKISSGYFIVDEAREEVDAQNPIVYSVGRYTFDGTSFITSDLKNYYIVKNTSTTSILNNIQIYNYQGNIYSLSTAQMNNYISQNNGLSGPAPKFLTSGENRIKTKMIISHLPPLNSPPNLSLRGGYHNFLTIGAANNQFITLDLDAKFRADVLFNTSFTSSLQGMGRPGIKQLSGTGPITLELIKGKNQSIDFNYNINYTASNLSVSVTPQIPNDLNGYITVTPTVVAIPVNKQIKTNIKFDLNAEKIITPPIIDKLVTIYFNYTVEGITFSKPLVVNVSIFDINQTPTVSISPASSIIPFDCSSSNCTKDLVATITNPTKTYDFNLTNISFIDADNNLTLLSNSLLPLNIRTGADPKIISITVTGDYDSLKPYNDNITLLERIINKNLRFNFSIIGTSNSGYNINKNLTFRVIAWGQTIQDLLAESGLYGNICLGVGGINLNSNNFYILGNCDKKEMDCKTGSTAIPKIKYHWGVLTDGNWATECVDNSATTYNQGNTHCDSAQMLFSVLSLINASNTGQIGTNSYIYLMSDGVSQDLLKDYRANTSFFNVVTVNTWPNNIFTNSNIVAGNVTIQKVRTVNNVDVPTNVPGKYQIILNDDFRKTSPSELHIKLKLVNEMPVAMRNLLYYLPIDGELGTVVTGSNKRLARDGYGSTISNDSNLLVFKDTVQGATDVYLYKTADGNISRTVINLINNQNNIKGTQESQGKMLDISVLSILLDGTLNLNVSYSPSYPIPIYAKVESSNTVGLSYKIKNTSTNTVKVITDIPFLVWKDYKRETRTFPDAPIVNIQGIYQRTQIPNLIFNNNYGNNSQTKLIKTILYWPVLVDTASFNNLRFLIGKTADNYGNDVNSKIYTLGNIDNNGGINSNNFLSISRIGTYGSTELQQTDVEDLFTKYITSNKACIMGGPISTTIRWIDSNIGFTNEQIVKIRINSNVDPQNEQETID